MKTGRNMREGETNGWEVWRVAAEIDLRRVLIYSDVLDLHVDRPERLLLAEVHESALPGNVAHSKVLGEAETNAKAFVVDCSEVFRQAKIDKDVLVKRVVE